MTASRLASAGYGSVSQMDSFDEDASPPSAARTLLNVVVGKFFPNILLVFMPFGWASYHYQWGDNYVFWFNFLAMVPLASILGDFTEEVRLNEEEKK